MQNERDMLHPSREWKSTKLQCRLKVDREHSVLTSDFVEMKNFTYQVEKLIKCVEERPAIWDKTLEAYKDKEERKQAWEEIFRCLDDRYDDMTRQERRTKSDIIVNKWTNIRDTFIKSLRVQALKSGTKKYIYYKELSFLLKNAPQHLIPENHDNSIGSDGDDPISFSTYVPGLKRERDDASSSTSLVVEKETKRTKKVEKQSRKITEKRDSSPESDYVPRRRSRKSEPHSEECPPVDFVEMSEVNDPRVMNEDEAFFASLLPSVVKYSEDERLEFRIEVLAVMKNINSKRRHMWGEATD